MSCLLLDTPIEERGRDMVWALPLRLQTLNCRFWKINLQKFAIACDVWLVGWKTQPLRRIMCLCNLVDCGVAMKCQQRL